MRFLSALLLFVAASGNRLKTFGTGLSAFHNDGPEISIFNYTLSAGRCAFDVHLCVHISG
jgi:hypothetical protein